MSLTKKIKSSAYYATHLDEALYEIHRRNMEELQRKAERLIHNRKRINTVLLKEKGVVRRLKILKVQMDDRGTFILAEK